MTTGAAVSGAKTVTVRVAVEVFPAWSRASTVNVAGPLGTSVYVLGEVHSVKAFDPSLHLKPATSLDVEAKTNDGERPTVAPSAGEVMLTWGAVRSAVTVTAASALTLPALSVARTLMMCWPAVERVNVCALAQGVNVGVESMEQVRTESASEVTPRTGDPLTVAPAAGDVMTGAAGAVRSMVNDLETGVPDGAARTENV